MIMRFLLEEIFTVSVKNEIRKRFLVKNDVCISLFVYRQIIYP